MSIKKEKNPYKPFTKDWFEYVWAYDKLYIFIIVVIFLAAFMYYRTIDNDIEIRIFGINLTSVNESEQEAALKTDFLKLTNDTNNDGRKHLHLNLKPAADVLLKRSTFIEMGAKGKATVQIVPKSFVTQYINVNKNFFMDMSQLVKECNIREDRLLVMQGKTYAIQVGGIPFFKDKDILEYDLFLIVRNQLEKEKNNRHWAASYENGLEIARYLLNNK